MFFDSPRSLQNAPQTSCRYSKECILLARHPRAQRYPLCGPNPPTNRPRRPQSCLVQNWVYPPLASTNADSISADPQTWRRADKSFVGGRPKKQDGRATSGIVARIHTGSLSAGQTTTVASTGASTGALITCKVVSVDLCPVGGWVGGHKRTSEQLSGLPTHSSDTHQTGFEMSATMPFRTYT